ncbi:ABC transporter ATP-binding protein [Cohnella hongkongensis]|uniref:ABC transporter ATP-binding protein n=1 Tax=Cohnella hongkongensis TaxID=178337 RepID=A0ABV9FKY9_9BACL
MLKFISRMLALAGEHSWRIKLAFVFSFLESLLANTPVFALLYIFTKIMNQSLTSFDGWLCGGIMLAAILARFALRRLFLSLQSGTGYEICARERLVIGDLFKRFPMSYFTEGNLGRITSSISVDLVYIEVQGMKAMDRIVNGFMSLFIGCVVILFLDWRIGLMTVVLALFALAALERLQRVGKLHSRIKQEQQAKLTSSILEYVRGMSIIKSLNMIDDKASAVNKTIENARDSSIDFEEKFTPPSFRYQFWFSLATALTVFMAASFYQTGTMTMPLMTMLIIYVHFMYIPVKALGSLTGQIRVMEAALDRYEQLLNVNVIDRDCKDIPLKRFDIEFKDVSFSYEENATLRNISFHVPEKSMTALVGASGSGKTTIANLIVRFWDVQQGELLVGGINVKELTCESLLQNISMVFQNVYLFRDTICNNIKFGKPNATFEEVVAAAKKARCHEFITSLEGGYDTIVGEGGGTLSGGEKQRISIARAILKDAPIILLDEATASVDPDNEKHIQKAISELVKDKTLIIIAHRLSTIRNADQIIVLDKGSLIQKGTHEELIQQDGQYRHLWNKRMTSRSWKIPASTAVSSIDR